MIQGPGFSRRILSRYGKLFRSIFVLLILIFLLFTVSALIVFPLWVLATKTPDIFSVLFCIAAAFVVLLQLFGKIRRDIHAMGLTGFLRQSFVPFLLKAVRLLLIASGTFLAVSAFAVGRYVTGILSVFAVLIVFGIPVWKTRQN